MKPLSIFLTSKAGWLLLSVLFAHPSTLLAWQPVAGRLLTPWGEKVTPQNVWAEYPRPSFAREQWQNLNGLWEYAVTSGEQKSTPEQWDGEILVPFPIEAALSGVGRPLRPDQALWYRRSFSAERQSGRRVLLHFEAVDCNTEVWVNGTLVGKHVGGNQPFSFDVTDVLRAEHNSLVVRVTDATDTAGHFQAHGKQVLKPAGIWYTAVSGIWQTVWLEQVPASYLADVQITTKVSGEVTLEFTQGGDARQDLEVEATATLDGIEVAQIRGKDRILVLRIPEPRLWSPASPVLYSLKLRFGEDKVSSYFGVREVSTLRDADGHLRFALNGREVFPLGPLDQGWWPDGLLTPPSAEAMQSDLRFIKAAGFNMLRKHIKVEPRRYYTDCDRIGLLVWQDHVSTGTGTDGVSPKWTRLDPNAADAEWPDWAHEQFMSELKRMVDVLYDHPSIVQWVPFNEAWGQHRTKEVVSWLVGYDRTRHVNAASGGNFFPVGHIVDHHAYPHPEFPFDLATGGRFEGFVKVVGEFGGHGFPVAGHLWSSQERNWGYGGLPKDKTEWIERYRTSMRKLTELKKRGIAAGVYTQTTDVEGEINGLITYDRKVQKLTPEELAAIHREFGLVE
jgi:beta-galactosidase/beta-glucuronidase